MPPTTSDKAVRAIAILGLVGALAGTPATAQEPHTAITDARIAAVSFALTMDLVTASLAMTCAKAGEALSVAAPAARSSWTQHNGSLVTSAHDYLLFQSAVVASEQGEDAGQAFYEEQKARLTADAHTALTETFPGGVIDANACPEVIANLGSGGMNLEAKPEFHQALVEIQDAISRLRQGPR